MRTLVMRAHTLALDSAIAAVVLGKRLNLPTDRLQALATGTILHDIGLNRSPQDFERYRAHPLLGYKILRNRFASDMQPAQIAYQHHGRQDGTGYPRGLSGTNQLKRTVQRQGGGNGGGAICGARHLANHGVETVVCLSRPAAELSPAAKEQLAIYRETDGRVIGVDEIGELAPEVVIDVLLGYGLSGVPHRETAALIEWCGRTALSLWRCRRQVWPQRILVSSCWRTSASRQGSTSAPGSATGLRF